MVTTVGAALMGLTPPAAAQFGSIFSDEPPRPPGNVPRGGQQMPPADLGRGGDVRSGVDVRRPNLDADQPPARPLPAPMSLPPSSRPGGGTIQSTPLAPPPGATAAPPSGAPVQPLPPPGEAPQGTARATPGLAPGIRQPRGAPEPADTSPQPGDEVVVAPPPQRIANPSAVFSGLDKITGRIISFDVAINETVQFGALQVTPRVCYTRPPTETPNTDAFIQVDEVTLQGEIKRIFEGWMFAASPGLHAVEHPIYDVWITDCKGGAGPEVAEAPPEPAKPAARTPARQPAQQRPPQPRAQQQPGLAPTLR
ncbi:MAG: DUF2155 domain-containing protein [Pseudolabrys sp.]|nr:DUF2155 domain-containing protein [Pseudolabrys sp.]MDP2295293.1 DUF2155 domain-containing protein [Pseudolabrys sp.]